MKSYTKEEHENNYVGWEEYIDPELTLAQNIRLNITAYAAHLLENLDFDLEIDPNNPDGVEYLAWLDDYVMISPRGGNHLLNRLPENLRKDIIENFELENKIKSITKLNVFEYFSETMESECDEGMTDEQRQNILKDKIHLN